MVICSGELDAADNRLANGIESEDEDDEQEENTFYLGNALKCLQIDLRRFGLGEWQNLVFPKARKLILQF